MTPQDLQDSDYLDLLESGLLVPHYLIMCFSYYEADVSLVPDHTFDELAQRLDREWDKVSHPNKKLIDRAALKSGGSYLRGRYPMRVKATARMLIRKLRVA